MYLFSYFTGNGEDGLRLAYSRDGLSWETLKGGRPFLKPEVGESKLMRDPFILPGPDGVYRMVWTAGWWERGIGYAYSDDLIHWSKQRYLPVMFHEPDAKNCWAPELFYDETTGEYLIFWSTTIPGRFPETDEQKDSNHRIYYVTTRDFESFSDTQLLLDPGFNVIDAAIVKDGPRYVMFIKDETSTPFTPQKNIRIVVSDRATGPYGRASEPITGDYWAEGPSVAKIDGDWIVYFDKYMEDRYGALRSQDLHTWEDISDRVHFPQGARHGSVFSVPDSIFERISALD